MKTSQMILLSLLTIPFIEIFLLLTVGGLIGVVPTVILVIGTAFLGAWLLRQQGFATWQRFQQNLAQGVMPAYEMIEGPILLVGGALLLTPGFFTDALGFICLVPQLRRRLAQYIIEHHLLETLKDSPFSANMKTSKDALEGEFRREN